jgi:asparagine synthetase B (glutamine-hydrolysing)
VVPNYFPDDQPATLGISEGLDCRTVLAALPQDKIEGLHSFTFGKPSSSEITEAADIAAHLRLNHTSILLDQAFLDRLPTLARDTVFLSGGQQNINRSHLLYTYGQLAYENRRYPLIATGVSGDHIFRDHIRGTGNIPHILSASAASQHHHGRQRVDRAFYASLVGDRFEAFEDRIERSLDHLQGDYGEFGDPESYLSYLMFEAGPRYFGGQTAIANAFSTFRTPYWDPEIISLGYRLQNATAGLSAAQPKKDVYLETRIQASVIAAHDTVGQLPYKDLPINVYARGSKARFQSHRLCRRLRSLLRRSRFIYSEDWRLWYQTSMRDEVRRLLGDDSRVREYVTPRFIEDAIATADVHWLGKLITTEHTLRFVETGWRQP